MKGRAGRGRANPGTRGKNRRVPEIRHLHFDGLQVLQLQDDPVDDEVEPSLPIMPAGAVTIL